MRLGSLPVPNHLRTAGDRRMKAHGIGVGYVFPHDFEGDDVAQQYLPDELKDRRYYVPNDQGHEVQIAARMAEREAGQDGEAAAEEPAEPADGRDVGRASPGRVEPAQDRRDPARGRRRLKADARSVDPGLDGVDDARPRASRRGPVPPAGSATSPGAPARRPPPRAGSRTRGQRRCTGGSSTGR